MGDKIRKFLGNFVKRDKLRVQVVFLTVALIFLSAIPVNLFSMYNELKLTTQREYEGMFARSQKLKRKTRINRKWWRKAANRYSVL